MFLGAAKESLLIWISCQGDSFCKLLSGFFIQVASQPELIASNSLIAFRAASHLCRIVIETQAKRFG
jgi:hypothetical protein